MKIVFFGTPDYVLPILETLHKKFKERHESPISAVVTQRPKPSGRNKLLKYSMIDQWAHDRDKQKFYNSVELVENNIEADIGILAAYGEIIPQSVIDHFPYGILNVHPSLLPELRGASPVQATLATGKDKAGVSIIRMDNELDHGPIVSQFTEEIRKSDTTESLRDRLFLRSADVLASLIPAYIDGRVKLKKQDHKKATFATTINKSDAFIDPAALDATINGNSHEKDWIIPFIKNYETTYSPRAIYNFIRAMNPWPIAWTEVKLKSDQNSMRLKLLKAHLEKQDIEGSKKPTDILILDEVQLEGKNPVTWKQFAEAYPDYLF